MALDPVVQINVLNLVAYHLLFTTVYSNYVQPNVRIHLASILIFQVFFVPVGGLCCRPKYWANIIHRFDDQNSLTCKCMENWALFERLTHSQRSALSACTRAPRGCAQHRALESQRFFCPVQGCVYKHRSAPGLTLEKISVSRGEAQPFGEFTQLSACCWACQCCVWYADLENEDISVKLIDERVKSCSCN